MKVCHCILPLTNPEACKHCNNNEGMYLFDDIDRDSIKEDFEITIRDGIAKLHELETERFIKKNIDK